MEQLLVGNPAHPRTEPADHLAAINVGVERSTQIHQDVDPRHSELAGQSVDYDLGDRGTVGEVKERIAPARLAIEVDPRRGVKAPSAQVDALFVGQLDELAK